MNTTNKTEQKGVGKPELPKTVTNEMIRKQMHAYMEAQKPAKAEHSPLPWNVNDISPYAIYVNGSRVVDCREANCICYTERDKANARLIVASVNNAAKLAEALRMWLDGSGTDPVAASRSALAAWDKEAGQ